MRQRNTIYGKLGQLVSILFPILVTQVSLCSMSFFDTMMSGHASQLDLAGVAIGTNLWMPVFTGINGLLIGITPIIAQLNGAGRKREIGSAVVQGVYLAVLVACAVLVSGAILLGPILDFMNLEPAVALIARHFLAAIALGIAPLFMSTILRSFIDTLGYTRITMMITVGALPVNILFNYLLIYGQWGFPHLGGAGAGYASAITYWVILAITGFTIYYGRPFREYRLFSQLPRISYDTWLAQLRLGIPIGTAIFCETSIFGVVGLLVADFGTITIAAHQAAINFASLVYMLPLGMSMTLTILVGFEVGAGREKAAREYAYLGLSIALFVATLCAAALFVFSKEVASLYTIDQDVLELTEKFLFYAAFFQLSDAIAAPIQGILRGYKDVTIPFVVAFLSYWVIGLPMGIFLSRLAQFGAFGYWIGFIAGLAFGATALAFRLVQLQKRR